MQAMYSCRANNTSSEVPPFTWKKKRRTKKKCPKRKRLKALGPAGDFHQKVRFIHSVTSQRTIRVNLIANGSVAAQDVNWKVFEQEAGVDLDDLEFSDDSA